VKVLNHEKVQSLIASGTIWIGLEQAVQLLLRLTSSIVMTRLLFPEAFGIMALVSIFVAALHMFTDTGIATSIIRDQRGEDRDYLNTAWTIQVIRGVILFGLCFALSPLFSRFYETPNLQGILYVLSLTFIVGGFNSMSIPLAVRRMQLGRLVIARVVSQLIATLAMIVYAFFYPTVWALVLSAALSPVILLALSYLTIDTARYSFQIERKALSNLFGLGKWVFFSSIAFFLATQADRLLLGKYIDLGLLGVYSIAIILSEPIRTLNWEISSSLVFPRLSKKNREQPETTVAEYYRIKWLSDAFFLTGIAVLVLIAQFLVNLIYDARYHEAGWMLEILCVRIAFQCLVRHMEHLLIVIGHVEFAFYQNICRLFIVLIGIPIGWHFANLEGVLWALVLSELFVYLLLMIGLARYNSIHHLKEVRSLFLILIIFVLALI